MCVCVCVCVCVSAFPLLNFLQRALSPSFALAFGENVSANESGQVMNRTFRSSPTISKES